MALTPGDKAVRVRLSDGFGAHPCSPVLDVGNRAVRARVSGGLTAVKASLSNVVGGYRIPCCVSDTETRAAVNLRWSEYWTQLTDFGGGYRYSAVAAAWNGKVYVGTGYTGGSFTRDWWAYDISADTWTQLTDYGKVAQRTMYAVAAAWRGRAFVGTGLDGPKKDWWVYDPAGVPWGIT